MIVVDNNVLVDFCVGEPEFRQAARDLLQTDSHWVAPSLWQYELGHVLGKYARLGHITTEGKKRAYQMCHKMVETVHILKLEEVDDVASECELSFYDASYLWLAKSKGVPLYTRDKKVLETGGGIAVPFT